MRVQCGRKRERGAPKAKEGSIKNYKFLLFPKVAKEWRNIPFLNAKDVCTSSFMLV